MSGEKSEREIEGERRGSPHMFLVNWGVNRSYRRTVPKENGYGNPYSVSLIKTTPT